MKKFSKYESGQTLVLLLMFVVMAIMITTAVIFMTTINSGATDKLYQGTTALDIAESGAETAMIKLIRDPSYTGETIPIGNGSAAISVTGTSPITVRSNGVLNNFSRTVEVSIDYSGSVLTILSWREVN